MLMKHRLGGGIVLIPGHIDVLMHTADCREQKKFGVQLVPRTRPRHTSRKAFFVARFDVLPTRGSVLVVTYHEGSHPISQLGSASASGPLSLVRRGGERARDGSDLNARTSPRSEEHTSELQSLIRNSYAVFCLKQ